MIAAFEFEESGRTYSCSVEEPRATAGQVWWWFSVSGDGNRYAPFQALESDTQDSVRVRIAAYYGEILARRAAPPTPRHHWARRSSNSTPRQ